MAAVLLYQQQAAVPDGLLLRLPLMGTSFSLGLWFIPLAIIVIVGASNAVNLTDGLDGLAGGCLLAATAAMTGLVYAAGHAQWAAYLGVPRIPAGRRNDRPGRRNDRRRSRIPLVQLPSGSSLLRRHRRAAAWRPVGLLAVVARQELVLVIVAGVFVVEAASVIVQVGYFKWRHRRLLRCAPLHHHFQFAGWAENKIVVRFWIASALCALLGAASLKLGVPTLPPDVVNRDSVNHSTVEQRVRRFVGSRTRERYANCQSFVPLFCPYVCSV